MKEFILNKAKEPSTYAGAAVLLGVFGVKIAPEYLMTFTQAATGVAGFLAILLNEKK